MVFLLIINFRCGNSSRDSPAEEAGRRRRRRSFSLFLPPGKMMITMAMAAADSDCYSERRAKAGAAG
jgi:hypothetical protein